MINKIVFPLLAFGLMAGTALAQTATSYDVVVVGGGFGGFTAAVQAARMGSKVLILEETHLLGGQLNTVPNMDGGNVPGTGMGIYNEFIERVRQYYATPGRFAEPKSIGTCYWQSTSKCFEPKVAQIIMSQMLAEVGVTVKTGVQVSSVIKSGNIVKGVRSSVGDTYNAKVTLDATEYGDVMPLAGVAYRVGKNKNGEAISADSCVQDITYTAPIKEYLTVPTELKITSAPPGYATYLPDYRATVSKTGSATWGGGTYPFNFLVHNAYRAVPDSSNPKNYVGSAAGVGISKTFINWANDYPNGKLSASYVEDKSYRATVNCDAKLKTIGFIYYLQTELGYPKWSIANDENYYSAAQEASLCANIPIELKAIEGLMPPLPYVRESRRLIPVDTLTAAEIQRFANPIRVAQTFESSVVAGDYPNDLHDCADAVNLESDLGESLSHITNSNVLGVFQVPFEALIPQAVDGFMAASKSIGTSRLANGSTRLQPIEAGIGQAVGAVAALAARNNIQPRLVKPFAVQEALLAGKEGVAVLSFPDVPTTNQFWADAQIASTYNYLSGYSSGLFGVNDNLTRGQAAVVLTKLGSIAVNPIPTKASFTDVLTSHYAYRFVEAFFREGITAGCSLSPMKFCPENPVTKEQFAVFLVRVLKLSTVGESVLTFTDVPSTSSYLPSISLAVKKGYMETCGTSQFCPSQNMKRGDVARVISRVLSSRNR